MRNVPPTLAQALAEPLIHAAWCVRLLRADGIALGLTSHDRDLVIDSLRYRAHPSLRLSAMTGTNRLNVDTLELNGILDHRALAADDLAAGRYDDAAIRVMLIDWTNPQSGHVVMAQGRIGSVSLRDDGFSAEVRSASQALQHEVGDIYTPECRATFGDERCKAPVAAHTSVHVVSAVTDSRTLVLSGLAAAANWYAYGQILWLSGANAGLRQAIHSSSSASITLRAAMPNIIAPGDRADIRAGCDKWFATCRDKFGNSRNFRGEPFIPGIDAAVRYPDA